MIFNFFDTETTGFVLKRALDDISQPHPVQVAALLCDERGNELALMNMLVKPDGWICPSAVSAIHGKTMEILDAHGLPEKIVWSTFKGLRDVADIDVIHNRDYDNSICEIAAARNFLVYQPKPYVCTMKSTTEFCGLLKANGTPKWPKLSELHHKLFDEHFEGAHDALGDLRAMKRCFFELLHRGIITLPNG